MKSLRQHLNESLHEASNSSMKLKDELPNIISRFKKLNKNDIIKQIESVVKSGNYRDLETYIIWNLFYKVYSNDEVSDLYNKYNAKDVHVETALKRAFKTLNIDLSKYPTKGNR